MSAGDVVIDICRNNDPLELAALVAASKAYWTSKTKDYKLISDDSGPDLLRVFESAIKSGDYDEGRTKYVGGGDVVLIYQR